MIDLFFSFPPFKRQIYFSGHWLYWLSIDFLFVCYMFWSSNGHWSLSPFFYYYLEIIFFEYFTYLYTLEGYYITILMWLEKNHYIHCVRFLIFDNKKKDVVGIDWFFSIEPKWTKNSPIEYKETRVSDRNKMFNRFVGLIVWSNSNSFFFNSTFSFCYWWRKCFSNIFFSLFL